MLADNAIKNHGVLRREKFQVLRSERNAQTFYLGNFFDSSLSVTCPNQLITIPENLGDLSTLIVSLNFPCNSRVVSPVTHPFDEWHRFVILKALSDVIRAMFFQRRRWEFWFP